MIALRKTSSSVGRATRAQMLIAIDDHRQKVGFAPTLSWLADRLDITISSVHFHLAILKEEGRVDWIPGAARTLRVRNIVSSFTRGQA